MNATIAICRALLAASSLAVAGSALAHNHRAYAHDSTIPYENPQWMALLDDNLTVSQLSLPGTHDSMSRHGGDVVATQSLPLADQLRAGVRAFDIRLRAVSNALAIHHGSIYQHAMFGDVLDTMVEFLRQHPGEVLFVRVAEEHSAQDSNMSFDEIFQGYYNRYAGYIANSPQWDPPLRELRGKIVFLQDFWGSRDYGMGYGRFDIQDEYTLGNNWELYDKWERVRSHLKRMGESPLTRPNGSINYLSASGGSFPYFVASGHSSPGTGAPRLATGMTTPGWKYTYPDFPRVNCFIGICTIAFEGINVLAHDYIVKNRLTYVGMVMADFPGPALIDAIIQVNLKPCLRWAYDGRATRGEVYRYLNPSTRTVDYFRSRKNGRYGYFPTTQGSNDDWEYLGHDPACRV